MELVIWQFDVFDRLVLKGWRFERQNLFMNADTGACTWRAKRGKK